MSCLFECSDSLVICLSILSFMLQHHSNLKRRAYLPPLHIINPPANNNNKNSLLAATTAAVYRRRKKKRGSEAAGIIQDLQLLPHPS